MAIKVQLRCHAPAVHRGRRSEPAGDRSSSGARTQRRDSVDEGGRRHAHGRLTWRPLPPPATRFAVTAQPAARVRPSIDRRSAGAVHRVVADAHGPEHLAADRSVALGDRSALAADEAEQVAPRLRERARAVGHHLGIQEVAVRDPGDHFDVVRDRVGDHAVEVRPCAAGEPASTVLPGCHSTPSPIQDAWPPGHRRWTRSSCARSSALARRARAARAAGTTGTTTRSRPSCRRRSRWQRAIATWPGSRHPRRRRWPRARAGCRRSRA